MFVRRPVRYSSIVHNRVFHHAFSKMQGSWYYLLTCWQNLSEKEVVVMYRYKRASLFWFLPGLLGGRTRSHQSRCLSVQCNREQPCTLHSCQLHPHCRTYRYTTWPYQWACFTPKSTLPSLLFSLLSSHLLPFNLPMGALQWTLICHLALSQSPSHAGWGLGMRLAILLTGTRLTSQFLFQNTGRAGMRSQQCSICGAPA